MPKSRFIEHPSQMEPLLPEDRDGRLAGLALEVIRGAERLRGMLHPVTRAAVVDLVRSMNSYYSNLIEGHRTRPADIDSALRRRFAGNAEQRSRQQMHWAHVETEKWMENALSSMKPHEICAPDFLCSLHREFYTRLPQEFQFSVGSRGVKKRVIPGKLRESVVTVGIHVPPAHEKLQEFLLRFAQFYGPLVNDSPASLIALAAAHHRLAWVHPFLDGNGRVTRLFTQAWLWKSNAAGGGLWTLARGFARKQSDYKEMLARADERRLNDFDGRGALSDRRLAEFCEFTLQTAVDQTTFMAELLALDGVEQRIAAFGRRIESEEKVPQASSSVLRAVFLRGEITRGEVANLAGVSPRTAQKITKTILDLGLVSSASPKGELRFAIPSLAAASYFPNLFPAGAE
jgi:Fic family protein